MAVILIKGNCYLALFLPAKAIEQFVAKTFLM